MVYPEDLVSLDQVKQHLRVTWTSEDDLIALYVKQATAIVLDYLTREDDDWIAEIEAWNDDTVPPAVQAAILMQTAELYRFRGDEDAPQREDGYMTPLIKAMLTPYRDPSVA
jgi:uncharacterized phage protein (predicted DNA packaging)